MEFILFVEGYTEKRAIASFLKRWLDPRVSQNIGIQVVRFDGWPEMVRDMPKKAKMYLDGPNRDEVVSVLALMDLCGPTFYPGHLLTSQERLDWATQEMEKRVGTSRFRMFFAVHEFEAWLLSQPEIFPRPIAEAIRKIPRAPEDINFDTPPSKCLSEFYQQGIHRRYKKTIHGVQLFAELDPNIACQKCPQLRRMLETMLKMVQDL